MGEAQDSDSIADRFQRLTRDSTWRSVEDVPLDFDAQHPQGMAVIGDRLYLSSVEVIDRAAGIGKAHLYEIGLDGKLARSVELTDGPRYHPSGMDHDGERIWVAVAEYRPDSSSVVYSVDPATLEFARVFAFNDHLGAIVHDRISQQLVAVSWGSRRFYRWRLEKRGESWAPTAPDQPIVTANPSHYIDYQDMQMISGTPLALCSGLASIRGPSGSIAIGGVDLVDTTTMRAVHQLPVPLWTPQGTPYTRNPVYALLGDNGGIRFYFLPGDGRATLHIVDAFP